MRRFTVGMAALFPVRSLVVLAAAALTLLAPGASEAGELYVVVSTADPGDGTCTTGPSGGCTLREAINAVSVNGSTILFNIPDVDPGCDVQNVCTINVTGTALPKVDVPVTIDGTSQPSYAPGSPTIVLEGSALPGFLNNVGLDIIASDTTIRGLGVEDFPSAGIHAVSLGLDGLLLDENVLIGNNGQNGGLELSGTNHVVRANTVSGSTGTGLFIGFQETSDVTIEDNALFGNGGDGMTLTGSGNVVQRNLVDNNAQTGIGIVGSGLDDLLLIDNVITNNARDGADVGGDNVTISGNQVSGNGTPGQFDAGIAADLTNSTVSGNQVTDNDRSGMWLWGSNITVTGNTVSSNVGPGMDIGRTGAHVLENTISDNGESGIVAVPLGPIVESNLITDNGGDGVRLRVDEDQPAVGATITDNVITGNSRAGVYLEDSEPLFSAAFGGGGFVLFFPVSVTISANSISGNGDLGIDLGPEGETPNDAGDGDLGPNNLQNAPVLTSAVSGSIEIEGTLNSTPGREFRIELFANTACDPSGSGEGEALIGSQDVTASGAGDAAISFSAASWSPVRPFITATATDLTTGDTSEFSNCIEVEDTPAGTATPTPSATPTPTGTPEASPTPTATAQPGLRQGDVDCNGVVNSVDALKVLRYVAQMSVAQEQDCPLIGSQVPSFFGDVDCTGAVTSVDALKILRFVAQLPVGQTEPCVDIDLPL